MRKNSSNKTKNVKRWIDEWIECSNELSNIIAAPYDESEISQKSNEMDAENEKIRAMLKAEFSKIFKELRKKWKKAGVSKRYILTKDFIGTPCEIFTTNISLEALAVYILAVLMSDDYYFTVEDFAHRCGTSRYKMRKCLAELEKCGFLFRQIDRIGSKYVTSYFFVESITAETIAKIFN